MQRHEVSHNNSRKLRLFVLVVALTCAALRALDAGGEPPATDAATAEKPAERIYASVFWQPPVGKRTHEVVAIDPQTGRCEKIVDDGLDPRLSPDGQSLAYWTFSHIPPDARPNPDVPSSEVWVKKLHVEAEPQQIWTGGGTPKLCWTHDGKHVIVGASILSPKREWQHSSYLVDPETTETSQLEIAATDLVTDCSRSAERVLTWSSRNRQTQVFRMRTDGSDALALTEKGNMAYQGKYSFDDKKIAFLLRKKGVLSVCTADADGKSVRIAFSEKGLTYPNDFCWSPDAKHLAVVLFDWSLDEQGQKVQRTGEDNHFRIAIMDLDGSNLRELTLDRAVLEIGSPDWK